MKKSIFFLTFLMLLLGGGRIWADDVTTLVDFDFTDNATFPANTAFSQTGETKLSPGENDIYFYNNSSNSFSLSNTDGLMFPANAKSSNYFVAIPLENINGEITITFTHKYNTKKAYYRYSLVEKDDIPTSGYTLSEVSSWSNAEDAASGDVTSTVTIPVTKSKGVLYFGQGSSSYNQLKGISVTTLSSGVLPLMPARNYTWTFTEDHIASSAATVLVNGDYNFEIKNASIANYGSGTTSVTGLGNITKAVTFDGEGSTSNKYVHVKVQGPCKITAFARTTSSTASTLAINMDGEVKGTVEVPADGTIASGYYVYSGSEAKDVYFYSTSESIYLFGIKVEQTLDQFEFNPDDVYYYNGSAGEFVNNTTFDLNKDYTDLRVKLLIDPDYTAELLPNASFSVSSDNPLVLKIDDSSEPAVFNKATDNRIYVDHIKVLSAGTATLTFTFEGSDNYAGPLSITQTFTVNKKAVSIRSAGSQPGNSAENAVTGAAGTTFNSLIVFTVDDITNLFSAGTIDKSQFEVSSSNTDVVNVADVTFSASADDLSKGRIIMQNMKKTDTAGSAVITLTYKGNAYYSAATTTFTRYTQGKQTFTVSVSDLTVQNTQKTNIVPKITNSSGHLIGFDGTSVVEIDDETIIDYNDYFDFTYSISDNDAGLSLDPTDNSIVLSAKGSEYVGNSATVTVTATVKDAYKDNFTDGNASANLSVTVIKRQGRNYLKFYLDKEKTIEVIDRFEYTMDGSTSVFADFPDGRIIYVDLDYTKLFEDDETVDQIWFSYNEGSSKTVSRASTGKNDYGAKLYLLNSAHGGMVPIHADALPANVYVNFQCYKKNSSGYESVGSVVPVKFVLSTNTRPDVVTYDPVSDGTLERSTAQSVDAIGTASSGNDVYAKFSSTGTNYTIEGLLNEPNVIYDVERTGVFSTEVAARKISGVQINYDGTDAYVSKMTTMTYWYLYATTLSLSQYEYHYDLDDDATPASIPSPALTATYYNKVDKENKDKSSGDAVTVTYRVDNYNGAAVTVDENTGEVTLGSGTGYAVVTVSYKNDEQITVNKRTSTMEDAQITYTIYLTRSSEHLPKIEPSSRKFYPTINVTVTADEDWDTWYIVQSAEPTEDDIRTNGTLVSAGANTTFQISATSTVWAVAYDGTSVYSKKISETYTLGSEVLPPYFVPAGLNASYPYYYYTPTLGVEARTQTTGSEVYYTIGYGSEPADPVINASGTIRYDGQEGITLTGNEPTYIKAIAYKDGIQSSVVTVSYIPSSLPAPHFDKNGSGNYTLGTVAVESTDHITVEEDASIHEPTGYSVVNFYTLDGTEPSSAHGIKATTHFLVLKTVTAKAVTVLYDVTGTAVSTSGVTTVNFTVSGSNVWEANDDTAPNRTMLSTDGLIISTDGNLYPDTDNNAGTKLNQHSLASGNSSGITYAQQYITATFGGFDHGSWSHFTISDPDLGQPLDGVGSYNLKNSPSLDNSGLDAKDEENLMYSHLNTGQSSNAGNVYYTGNGTYVSWSNPTTTHEKTFKLPAQGTFVKFEPERDGDLTIWALQQGAIHWQNDDVVCDRFIRRRPVYFVDEQGNSIRASEAVSSARLSGYWSTIINGYASDNKNWFTPLGGTQNGATNNFYNQDESDQIYNMFMDYFQKRGDYATGYGSDHINVGDPIQPIPIHTASRSENPITERGGHNADNSTDMTGYVLASGGYVRYTFPVKAGKTYFFFGHATKVGIRGFRFTPTETVSLRPELTLKTDAAPASSVSVEGGSDKSLASAVTDYAGRTVNVTVQRTFKANTWTSLVLPFSVSVSQIEKVFGDFTDIVLFDDVRAINNSSDSEIHLLRHWHKMVVAGTPLLIKPTNGSDIVNPKFEGVQLETSEIDEIESSNGYYKMTGTFVNAENALKKWDYYINSAGNFSYMTGDQATVKGTRSWLKVLPANPNPSRLLSVAFSDFDDEGSTTGIINVEMSEASNNEPALRGVYNLKGQKVSDGSLENLPKGIYIVNGKKKVVE